MCITEKSKENNMNSEKVKEIKKVLNTWKIVFHGITNADILTLINELESENEQLKNIGLNEEITVGEYLREMQRLKDRIAELEETNKKLKQSNKNIVFVNDKLIERNEKLEEALLDMVVQFCQMGEEGYLKHAFMSAEENAFDVLDINYGEKVADVWERFNKKWKQKTEVL